MEALAPPEVDTIIREAIGSVVNLDVLRQAARREALRREGLLATVQEL